MGATLVGAESGVIAARVSRFEWKEEGMPAQIGRDEVLRLVGEEGAQLVEVLPPEEYRYLHLPGAINVPLEELDARAHGLLDPARPVVVYCHDYL